MLGPSPTILSTTHNLLAAQHTKNSGRVGRDHVFVSEYPPVRILSWWQPPAAGPRPKRGHFRASQWQAIRPQGSPSHVVHGPHRQNIVNFSPLKVQLKSRPGPSKYLPFLAYVGLKTHTSSAHKGSALQPRPQHPQSARHVPFSESVPPLHSALHTRSSALHFRQVGGTS